MTYKMIDLKGIDESQAAQLREAGIENTDEMMEHWTNQTKRTSLGARTGFSEDQLGRLAAMARVARMEGVGPKYAHLLVSAGVKGRKSLSTFTPEGLVQHLTDVSAAKSLKGPVPTIVEVRPWFAAPAPKAETPATSAPETA